jgi:hypothetical protein
MTGLRRQRIIGRSSVPNPILRKKAENSPPVTTGGIFFGFPRREFWSQRSEPVARIASRRIWPAFGAPPAIKLQRRDQGEKQGAEGDKAESLMHSF